MFRMVDLIADRKLDAVTFTSAPAVAALMDAAGVTGRRDEVVAAFQADVVATCVGPVTAAAFELWGVPTIRPERSRLAAMVKLMETELPRRVARGPPSTSRAPAAAARRRGLRRRRRGRLSPAPLAVPARAGREPRPRGLRAELLAALPRERRSSTPSRWRSPGTGRDRHPARADRGQARVPPGGG